MHKYTESQEIESDMQLNAYTLEFNVNLSKFTECMQGLIKRKGEFIKKVCKIFSVLPPL